MHRMHGVHGVHWDGVCQGQMVHRVHGVHGVHRVQVRVVGGKRGVRGMRDVWSVVGTRGGGVKVRRKWMHSELRSLRWRFASGADRPTSPTYLPFELAAWRICLETRTLEHAKTALPESDS